MSGDLEVVRGYVARVCRVVAGPINCGAHISWEDRQWLSDAAPLVFAALSRLEAQEPKECPACGGRGHIEVFHEDLGPNMEPCPECGEQPTPPVECPACAQAQRELERRTGTLYLAVRLKLQAQAKIDALTREVEKLVDALRPFAIKGWGPMFQRAAALLVEHEKEQG